MYKKLFAILLILALCAVASNAATVSWTGNALNSNAWNNADNWNPGVPASGDDVVLGNGNVEVTAGASCRTISFAGATLKVNSGVTLSTTGNVNVTSGTNRLRVEATGTFTVGQQLRFAGSPTMTMQVDGTAQGGIEVSGNPTFGFVDSATGSYVIQNSKSKIFNAGATFPLKGWTFEGGAHTFNGNGLGTRTLRFNYAPTISGTWNFENTGTFSFSINFANGVTLGASAQLGVTDGTNAARPSYTWQGTVSVTGDKTVEGASHRLDDVNSGSELLVMGGSRLTLKGQLNIDTSVLTIMAGTTLDSENTDTAVRQTTSVVKNCQVTGALDFEGIKLFSGAQLTFTQARTVGADWQVNNVQVYRAGLTLNSGADLSGSGSFNVYNNLVVSSSNEIDLAFNLMCDATFPITGSAVTVNSAVTVMMTTENANKLCTVTSPAWILRGSLTTNGGNTTATSFNVDRAITFSGAGTVPSGVLNQLTIGVSTVSGTSGTIWTVNNVVLKPPAGNFAINVGNSIQGSGKLWLDAGTFTINTGAFITIEVYVSNAVAFSAPSGYVYSQNLYLMGGTVSAVNGDFRFTGDIAITEGVSTVSGSNFLFFATNDFTLRLLNGVNRGGQLIVTGDRIQQNGVDVDSNRLVVTFQGVVTVNGTGDIFDTVQGAEIQFTAGTLNALTSFNMDGNITFTVPTNINGVGSVTFRSGSQTQLNLFGNLNAGSSTGRAIVTIQSNVLKLYNDVTIGAIVALQAGSLMDDDNDPNVISRTLTAESAANNRRILNDITLGANLIVTGGVQFNGATYGETLATITLQGNDIRLAGSTRFDCMLNIMNAATLTASGSRVLTFGNNKHMVAQTLTVDAPAQILIDNNAEVTLGATGGIAGTATRVEIEGTLIATAGTTTVAAITIDIEDAVFTGSNFVLVPSDNNLQFSGSGSNPVAVSTVTYAGPQVSFFTTRTINSNFVFTAANLEVTGSVVFSGDYTIANTWTNSGTMTFQDALTLNGQLGASSAGSLVIEKALNTNGAKTIEQPVTFGGNTGETVAVSNNGQLSLNADTITVNAEVVTTGGTIVSTKNLQLLSGSGSIPAEWTWTVPLRFGALNITGARTLTRMHQLTSASCTWFVDGVTLNAGAALVPQGSVSLCAEKFVNVNVDYTLQPQVSLQTAGTGFVFGGSNTLTVNGTYNCRSETTFTRAVIFGYLTQTTAADINLLPFCEWKGTNTIQIWRDDINGPTSGATVPIENPITFGLNVPVSVSGRVLFNGDITSLATQISFGSPSTLGSITFTSLNNQTLSGVSSNGVLTFASTSPIEPTVTFRNGLNFPIVLNGPVLLPSPTMGNGASVSGTARLAITNQIILNGVVTQFTAPLQIYSTNANPTFTFATGGQALVLSGSVSLFNPLGFANPSVTVNGGGQVWLNLNGQTLPLADLTVTSTNTLLRLQAGTISFRNVEVANNATLWLDGATVSASTLKLNQNAAATAASNFQFTISSASPTPLTVAGNVVVEGVAVVVVDGFAWDGTAVTAITSTNNQVSNNQFAAVRGSEPYTFTAAVSRANVQFSGTLNPTPAPAPTQSTGPTPAVSSAVSATVCYLVLALSAVVALLF